MAGNKTGYLLVDQVVQILYQAWPEMLTAVQEQKGQEQKGQEQKNVLIQVDVPALHSSDADQPIGFEVYTSATQVDKRNLLLLSVYRAAARRRLLQAQQHDGVAFVFFWPRTGQSLSFLWDAEATRRKLVTDLATPATAEFPNPQDWKEVLEASGTERFEKVWNEHRKPLDDYKYVSSDLKIHCERVSPEMIGSELQIVCDRCVAGDNSIQRFLANAKNTESSPLVWLIALAQVDDETAARLAATAEQKKNDEEITQYVAGFLLTTIVEGVATIHFANVRQTKVPATDSVVTSLLRSAWRDLVHDFGITKVNGITNNSSSSGNVQQAYNSCYAVLLKTVFCL